MKRSNLLAVTAMTMLWVAPGLMAQADLSITKSDDVDPVGPGDNVVYTVLVTNAGPASADVDFADQLPLGLGFISLSSTQGALSESGGLITGSLGTLSSGEIASVEITTVVNLLARGVLTNQAAVDSVTPDPVTADNLVSETTTILASADISLDKAVSPPPHVAGTQFDYFLNATNNGPDISTGSFISDILPAGITFVSATTQQGIVSHENNEILATIGNGAVGAQVQVVVTCLIDPGIQAGTVLSNNATAEANEFDGNSVNNSRSESITVSTSADLGITKSDSDDPAISGRTLTYTVVVTNAGPSVADNVVITDVLPVEVTFATAEITAGTVMEAGGTVTGNITQMLVGEIATLEIQATIGSLVSGTITNSADVTSDDPDPNGANDAVIEDTFVLAGTDLGVTKSASPEPAVAGADNITYIIEVTNAGPYDSTGVTVLDPIPANTAFVSVTPSQGSASLVGSVVSAELGDLSNGATASIEVVVSVDADGAGIVTNTATASHASPESAPDDNTASANTTVVAESDLGIVKSADPEPATPGLPLTYTLVIANAGPSDAAGIEATDVLPAGTSFLSAISTQGSVEESAGTVTASIGTLAVGEVATVEITVDTDPAHRLDISNTADVSSASTDPNGANDSSTAITSFVAAADLGLTKSSTPASNELAQAGETLTYLLTVTNSGPSTSSGIIVLDDLPLGVTANLVTPSQGTTEITGQIVSVEFGALGVGASASAEILVDIDLATFGSIINIASAEAVEVDLDLTNNLASLENSVNGFPEISVAPASLEFGDTRIVAGSTDVVVITNEGTGLLEFTSISIAVSPEDGFTLDMPDLSDLAVGASREIEVSFDPPRLGALSNILRIVTNDDDEGQVDVSLSGSGFQTTADLVDLLIGVLPALGLEATDVNGDGAFDAADVVDNVNDGN